MNRHIGGNFDDFLEEDGILEEVSAKAHKRLLSIQLADIMRERQITENVFGIISLIEGMTMRLR